MFYKLLNNKQLANQGDKSLFLEAETVYDWYVDQAKRHSKLLEKIAENTANVSRTVPFLRSTKRLHRINKGTIATLGLQKLGRDFSVNL